MVMKMNKTDFIKELSNRTGYNENRCLQINNIIEETFLIGKKNKEKMINDFENKLSINEDEANKIYEIAMNIISSEIKNKLKHPLKKM